MQTKLLVVLHDSNINNCIHNLYINKHFENIDMVDFINVF